MRSPLVRDCANRSPTLAERAHGVSELWIWSPSSIRKTAAAFITNRSTTSRSGERGRPPPPAGGCETGGGDQGTDGLDVGPGDLG